MAKNSLRTKWAQLIVHLLAYNTVWFVCIKSAPKGFIWAGLILAIFITTLQYLWQHFVVHESNHLLTFLIYLTLIGFMGDSSMMYLGVITFSANPFSLPIAPPFMLGIWLNFAMLFYALLKQLINRPALLFLFSFVGFGVAYQLGANMGAATLLKGLHSLFIISAVWAFLFPMSIILFNRLIGFPKDKT